MMSSRQIEAEDKLEHNACQKCRVINQIEQYARAVRSYSSQYGSDNSMSYTALNILGKPKKYPSYGDFPQTYTPRTHGTWWKKAPSGNKRIRSQCYEFKDFESTDFIELEFSETVFPQEIQIFETFQTGTICAIWALCLDGNWRNLWKGKPDYQNKYNECSRIFTPKLKHCFLPTSVIRLELDSTHHDSFPALDAVCLKGFPITAQFKSGNKPLSTDFEDLYSVKELNKILQKKIVHDDDDDVAKFPINSICIDKFQGMTLDKNGLLGILPSETIFKIFDYLDLKSLFRCSMLNSFYYQHAMDSLLFKELNCKVYWPYVDSKVLSLFTNRCFHLQKLDMSWCTTRISESSFINFLSKCGRNLTHLRLDSAQFVHDESVKSLPIHVPNLKELSLSNCYRVSESALECLKDMKQLEKLNLYQTAIHLGITKIFKTNGRTLRHLNIGGCNFGPRLDEIAASIYENCPHLESIDFWKSGQISPNGIRQLGSCHRLLEIDLGWCLGTTVPDDSIKALAGGCQLLEKVFLGALRGARDQDLVPLLDYCLNLKQIDLMGSPGITPNLIKRFLTECSFLEFIDVSCCNQMNNALVNSWRLEFPNISIQAIIQTAD